MSKELIGVKFPPYGDFKTGISSLVLCWGALQSSYCCNLTLFTSLDTRFSRLTSTMTLHHKFLWHYTLTTSLILTLQTKSKAILYKQFMNWHDTKTWKPGDKYCGSKFIRWKHSLKAFFTSLQTPCAKPINSVSRFPRTSSDFKIGSFQSMAYAANQKASLKKANNVQ